MAPCFVRIERWAAAFVFFQWLTAPVYIAGTKNSRSTISLGINFWTKSRPMPTVIYGGAIAPECIDSATHARRASPAKGVSLLDDSTVECGMLFDGSASEPADDPEFWALEAVVDLA